MPADKTSPISLSVVIPAYNAATWLPKSLPKIAEAIAEAHVSRSEIIVVDDGSTDDTAQVAKSLKLSCPVRLVSQRNSGRFEARRKGLEKAEYHYILLIDTRVFIHKQALRYVLHHLDEKKDRVVWSSHVVIDKKGNPYARFWDAITFIAWRKYFANPRDCSYGAEDFDLYPKGTTCFFAPKSVLQEANEWFSRTARGVKASNDDTLLIRHICDTHKIYLSPQFSCTYHARSNLKQFIKHTYHRGKVFVDGFLRRDGNRFFWPLVLFLVLSVTVPIWLVFYPRYLIIAATVAVALWCIELIVTVSLRAPFKDALSLLMLSPLFALIYGAGIWAAVLDMLAVTLRARSSN